MEEYYKSGHLRSIGVSNYTISHLKELMENCDVIPHVNQVYTVCSNSLQFLYSDSLYEIEGGLITQTLY